MKLLALFGLAFIVVAAIGCGGGEGAKEEDTRAADLEALQAKKDARDAKRAELAELIAAQEMAGEEGEEPAAEGEEAPAEGEEAAPDPEAQIAQLEAEIVEMSDELMTSVVDFINADPPVQGEPFNEFQTAAIRMKSAEDIQVADEYINQGGDYRRAIRIYEDALVVDPDNPDLQQRLASAQELRYMSEERFAQVKKGMSQDEVRELLGPVNLRNIREYPDKGVTSWFYTKENGGAAGVHYREQKGELRVYQSDFDAVKPPEEREAE
jgi:tetratricopeptide (TPR) repeat protein